MNPPTAALMLPLLRRAEPERAHRLAVLGLRLGLAGRATEADDPVLASRVLGLLLRNPLGLAAGFDKDALAIRGLQRQGFGFVEAGTVTPRAQPGNARPRVFRLVEDGAVINRYGFNNRGVAAFAGRLARLPRRRTVPVGANVGLNKDGADAERDYPALIAAVAPWADYLVINVSSPNTPGLRDLQGEARLRSILRAVRAGVPERPPLLVKVAPDLRPGVLEGIVEVAVEGGAEGLVVSNTTVARPDGLRSPLRWEAGGLSGTPLFAASTALLAQAHRLSRGRLVLVGAGGVASGADALAKLRAGASLVQVYTAFALEGPGLVRRIKRELAELLRRDGFRGVAEAVGTAA